MLKNKRDHHCQGKGYFKSECIQVYQCRAEKYFCFSRKEAETGDKHPSFL